MARQRRGGGFRPPELRGTLGTLLRTTREVLERGAREGRERLDEALASRRRDDALAELGEIVLDLIRRGEIDLGELPEVRDVVARLDDLDEEPVVARPSRPPPVAAAGSPRDRFDRRASPRSPKLADDGTVSSRTWKPPVRSAAPAAPAAPPKPDRKGGITFDDDDLADYMHPDDVPPKGSGDGDS